MATFSNMMKGNNPLSQMKSISTYGQSLKFGDAPVATDIVFNPTQRLDNQMKTASQVMNYAASKQMSEQGRTDMGGNVVGYSDTLG